MADLDGLKVSKEYYVDQPVKTLDQFFVKGAHNLDYGMKKHLSNIFNPVSGNTVMSAFDHGYFMGSTAGLERLDIILPKLNDDLSHEILAVDMEEAIRLNADCLAVQTFIGADG